MLDKSYRCIGKVLTSNNRIKVLNLNDGTNHYNLGTDHRHPLGKILTIYAKREFIHPKLGRFSSLTGFNMYLRTGRAYDRLRDYYGIMKSGLTYAPCDTEGQMYKYLYEAICAQYSRYPELQEALRATGTKPLTNYHVFGNSIMSRPEYKLLLRALGQYRQDSMLSFKGDEDVNYTHVTTGELR